MNFEDYKFMSLGSNCADIWYLGKNRIPGPIDNIVVKSFDCIMSLMNKTFFNKIFEEQFEIQEKLWEDSDDLKKILEYKDFKLVHNNPNTDKFKKNLDTFTKFISNMGKTDYLVFNVNSYFINEEGLPTKEFIFLIAWLKDKNLLHKVIFIQLFNKEQTDEKWDAHLSPETVKAFGLKTVNIIDVTVAPESYYQFKEQFIALERKS